MAGLSLQNIADRLGNVVSKQSLNKYEQGKMKPDSDLIIALSEILKVPVDFFFSEPAIAVELTNVDFRKYSSKLSKTEEAAVEEKSKEAFERYFELENILSFNETTSYFVYPYIISNAKDGVAWALAWARITAFRLWVRKTINLTNTNISIVDDKKSLINFSLTLSFWLTA